MLRKQADALAESVTDLLVRQKQISLGVPSMWGAQRESIISVCRACTVHVVACVPFIPPASPLPRLKAFRVLFCTLPFNQVPKPPAEIQSLIEVACGDDPAVSVLTQELLVYLGMYRLPFLAIHFRICRCFSQSCCRRDTPSLSPLISSASAGHNVDVPFAAMFIRSEQALFNEMLRVRVGLIIKVMVWQQLRTSRAATRFVVGDGLYRMFFLTGWYIWLNETTTPRRCLSLRGTWSARRTQHTSTSCAAVLLR